MESVVLAIQTIKYGWVFDGGDDDCHLNEAVVCYPVDHGRILCEYGKKGNLNLEFRYFTNWKINEKYC